MQHKTRKCKNSEISLEETLFRPGSKSGLAGACSARNVAKQKPENGKLMHIANGQRMRFTILPGI
jgi:hypothetical protein